MSIFIARHNASKQNGERKENKEGQRRTKDSSTTFKKYRKEKKSENDQEKGAGRKMPRCEKEKQSS